MSMVSVVCLRRVGSLAAAAPSYLAPQILSAACGGKKFEADILNKSKFAILPSNSLENHFGPKKNILESQIFGPLTRSEFLVSDNDIVQCSSGTKSGNFTAPASEGEPKKQSDKPTEEELEEVAAKLVYHLSHFYIQKVDYRLFRIDIVHENRITGKTTVGSANYLRDLSLMKIYGHIRFAFVRLGCLSYNTQVESGVVKIRWQISGMGVLRMIALYFPKQLFRKENMIKNAEIVSEGVSYYFIDGQGKVYRHITDNKEEDKDREHIGLKDKLKEKVQKLAPKSPNPATF